MQVLCIESCLNPETGSKIRKGEIYNSIEVRSLGITYENVDMWHILKELPRDAGHISILIDLPDQEGVIFSKKEELVEV